MAKRHKSSEIQDFILRHVVDHPTDITRFTARNFQISPQAVNGHIVKLVRERKLRKEGERKHTKYFPSTSRLQWVIDLARDDRGEDEVWRDTVAKHIGAFPENIGRILRYIFTEMFNNVLDHSKATTAVIELTLPDDDRSSFVLSIDDNGVGIFKKIKEAFGLIDERESILELTKGKVTTDKARHSGEGIFFTSRVVDNFNLLSGKLFYARLNREDDW